MFPCLTKNSSIRESSNSFCGLHYASLYFKLYSPVELFDQLVYGDLEGHAPSLGYDLLDGLKKTAACQF